MSIKIYSGVRFKTKSEAKVDAALAALRPRMQAAVGRQVARLMGTWVAAILDSRSTGIGLADDGADIEEMNRTDREGEVSSPYALAWMRFTERMRKIEQTRRRDPEVDFDFKVEIWNSPSGLLGMYNTECDALEKMFKADPLVQSWGYWDNTDEEDGVSAREWAARRRAWKWVIKEDDRVWRETKDRTRSSGRTVILCDRVTTMLAGPSHAAVAAQVPSLAKRVARLAHQRAMDERCRAMHIDDTGRELPFHEAMRIYHDARHWMETEEGRAFLTTHEDWARERMAPAITEDMVRDGFTATPVAPTMTAVPDDTANGPALAAPTGSTTGTTTRRSR